MSWDNFEKEAKAAGGGGLFVSLKDGDYVVCKMVGEPVVFFQKYPDKTEYAKRIDGSSFRFKVNIAVLNEKTGDIEIKIFSQGSTVAKAIAEAKEEYGLDTWLKIKRTGSGKDDTTYTCLYKGVVTDEQKATIDKMDKNDLALRRDVVKTMPDRMSEGPPITDGPF